jgi:TatA/E family protein of Tat protein translocase
VLTDILQPTHLLRVLVVALMVLGPKRLPTRVAPLGQGLKEFKNSIFPERDGDHG